MRWLSLSLVLLAASPVPLRALITPLSRPDIERALALARWRHTDADRARFHRRYTFPVHQRPLDSWIVSRIEVITEFRRVELMAEQHASDLWGRGSLKDVEEALRPHRGRVSILAHLELRTNAFYIGSVPPVEIVVGGDVAVLETRRRDIYSNCGEPPCLIVGGEFEAIVEASALGNTFRPVTVLWNDRPLASITIDFAALE